MVQRDTAASTASPDACDNANSQGHANSHGNAVSRGSTTRGNGANRPACTSTRIDLDAASTGGTKGRSFAPAGGTAAAGHVGS